MPSNIVFRNLFFLLGLIGGVEKISEIKIISDPKKPVKKCCSLWLVTDEWQKFQTNTMRIYGKKKSASDRINEFIKNENLGAIGKGPEVSLDEAIEEARQKLQNSFAASMKLEKMWGGGDTRVRSYICDFAHHCGIPRLPHSTVEILIDQISKNPDLMLKLYNAKSIPKGRTINDTVLELFIEYIEEKIKQIGLKKRLSELRNKRAGIDIDALSASEKEDSNTS